jgi:hypothetical protein
VGINISWFACVSTQNIVLSKASKQFYAKFSRPLKLAEKIKRKFDPPDSTIGTFAGRKTALRLGDIELRQSTPTSPEIA